MDTKTLFELKKCETLEQVFEVVKKNYNTREKLGLLVKGQIMVGVDKLIDIAKLKKNGS